MLWGKTIGRRLLERGRIDGSIILSWIIVAALQVVGGPENLLGIVSFGIRCVVESSCVADCIKLVSEHRHILQTGLLGAFHNSKCRAMALPYLPFIRLVENPRRVFKCSFGPNRITVTATCGAFIEILAKQQNVSEKKS
jgi:hypothetical protein